MCHWRNPDHKQPGNLDYSTLKVQDAHAEPFQHRQKVGKPSAGLPVDPATFGKPRHSYFFHLTITMNYSLIW
jgi:hypothetical protein